MADIVLDDFITWAIEALHLRLPKHSFPRTYTSFVIVDFKSSTAALFQRFKDLQALIADSFAKTHPERYAFDTWKLAFSADPTVVPRLVNTEYAFDRRVGAPFAFNRYFCSAPLRTEDHIELLKRFEALF